MTSIASSVDLTAWPGLRRGPPTPTPEAQTAPAPARRPPPPGPARLAGAPARAAHAHYGVPERAGPEPDLDPPAGDDVQGGGGLRQHGRRPQGQVRDVGEEADVLGDGHEGRDERPGVQEPPLVGVVLDTDEVEARPVGGPRGPRRAVWGVGARGGGG